MGRTETRNKSPQDCRKKFFKQLHYLYSFQILGWSHQEIRHRRACSMHDEQKICAKFRLTGLGVRRQFEDLGVHRNTVLNRTLCKQVGMVCSHVAQDRNRWQALVNIYHVRVRKKQGISWTNENYNFLKRYLFRGVTLLNSSLVL
jgi:hypothetical protein